MIDRWFDKGVAPCYSQRMQGEHRGRRGGLLWSAIVVGGWLIGAAPCHGATDVYRFVDERGVMHFTNTPTDARFHRMFPRGGNGSVRSFRSSTQMEPSMLDPLVLRAAEQYGVEAALIKAIIKAESDFDPYAVSPAGAQGLMQLMPETAERLEVGNPFDPTSNVFGGVRHLRELLDRFDLELPLALAAYNAGTLRVETAGGIPAIEETRRYVHKVLTFYQLYRSRTRSDAGAGMDQPVRRVVTPDGATLLTNSPSVLPVAAHDSR